MNKLIQTLVASVPASDRNRILLNFTSENLQLKLNEEANDWLSDLSEEKTNDILQEMLISLDQKDYMKVVAFAAMLQLRSELNS
jgi:predicted house-cleaning noncanonical NTP pyrophosphatase (MazG superfamily)